MSFQDLLRNHLQQEADAVALPEREPGRAVARARTRRRRRRAGVGVATVLAVVGVAAGVVPAVGGDGGEPDADVAAGVEDVLPATGPLTFDWRATDDGLSGVSSSFQAADGTVYALSTGPGFRPGAGDEWPRALYRLGDDGTWQPIDLGTGDRPNAIDMAANGDGLYAVGTGPGAGDTSVAQVSASTDGGDTWAIEDVPAVEPPSDEVTWLQDRYLTVENAGDTTIALVTTSFRLDVHESFPELGDFVTVDESDDGLVVSTTPEPPVGDHQVEAWNSAAAAEGSRQVPAPTTTVPETDAAGGPPSSTPTTVPAETRTLTWAELGISGPEDLGPTYQVLRTTGSGWEPVDATGLSGDALTLGTAGGKFVAEAFSLSGTTVLISDDGASWTPVSTPPTDGFSMTEVASVGPALVAGDPGGSAVHVSTDAGSTWQPVDLASAGVPDDFLVQSVDAGPLGVAVVVTGPDGWDPQLVVSGDLVDWTATPITDIVGDDPNTSIEVTVGADRIVVTSTLRPPDQDVPSPSRTAVGTPTRS